MARLGKRKELPRLLRRYTLRLQALLSLWRPVLQWAVAAGLVIHSAGCTRNYYRKEADKEVSEVLAQKDKYPAWSIDNFHVYPDPKARFADNSNPDHPPKPPDDPAAYDLSPNPQKPGKAGIARVEGSGYLELIAQWDRENRARQNREAEEESRLTGEPALLGPRGSAQSIAMTAPSAPAAAQAPNTIVPASNNVVVAPTPAQVARSWQTAPVTQGITTASSPWPSHAPVTTPVQPPPAPPAPVTPIKYELIVEDDAKPKSDAGVSRDTLAEVKSKSSLDFDGQRAFLITLPQAAELAMINSREYQDARENLYLAALPVTQERFSFMTQLFAAQEAVRDYSGASTAAGQANNWSVTSGAGFSKVLSTGALLLLNVSNQTVFNFLGTHPTVSVTSINFSAIQPFLQGGGQAVALESLTQAERNLLYQIRNFARFRKELYVEIASNNGGSINGASFQPTGVLGTQGTSVGNSLGNSGLTPGVPQGVTTTITQPTLAPSPPGSLNLSNALTPAPSGYLNTMLQKLQVYIDKENIDVLGGILQRYRGLLEGDIVGPLQVQSVEQQLLSGRVTLLSDQQDYLDALNSFKIELGVPVDLALEVDDSVLQPLIKQFKRERAIIDDERESVTQASNLDTPESAPTLRAKLKQQLTGGPLVRKTEFAKNIVGRLDPWEKRTDAQLRDQLEAIRKETQKLLDRQADLLKQDKTLSPEELDRLRELNSQADMGNYEKALRKYLADYTENGQPRKVDAEGERRRKPQFRDVISFWQKVLVEARDERLANVRSQWPELPRCCVDGVDLVKGDLQQAETTAGRHAVINRLDLMNIRAQVVDSWRQLAVYANALLGVFNVAYNAGASTPANGGQPLNFVGSGLSSSVTLNTQLPLVRLAERNNYRASLIAYQRQRRALEEGEDLAIQVVRAEIHNLRVYAESYKIQQRQLELAYLTIDSSLESLQAPTPPGAARSGQDGPAALTQQLLSAQRSLPSAQNGLLTIWINYLDQRLQLYRDLELMPLDARGVWIDEIRACDCGLEQSSGSGNATGGADQKLAPRPAVLPPPSKQGVE